MQPKVTKRWVPVNRPGEPSGGCGRGGGGGADPAADHLSALPDALLHNIMAFMKAWEVVRTCVLSRRWRNLWASAPCIDVRVGLYSEPPEEYAKFMYGLLLARDMLAPVDTLRVRLPGDNDEDFDDDDVMMWIRNAIRRRARVIQLNGHLHDPADLDPFDFASCHLRILKLSYADLDDKFVRQLFSRCPSLEELDLKRCEVAGREMVSASLKSLTMIKCQFTMNLSVEAPNLVSQRCVVPENWVPLFKNFGSLVTASVVLDDSLLSREFRKYQEEVEFAQTSDEDDGNNIEHFKRTGKHVAASDDSDEFMSDGYGSPDDYGDLCSNDIKDNYDYGSDINSDSETYEYSEIANGYEDRQFGNTGDGSDPSKGGKHHGCSTKYVINDYRKLGGQNLLQSLSNALSLDLLGHSG